MTAGTRRAVATVTCEDRHYQTIVLHLSTGGEPIRYSLTRRQAQELVEELERALESQERHFKPRQDGLPL